MKKLKVKVFTTIFFILTCFVLVILTYSVMRNYYERKYVITKVLNNMTRFVENPNQKKDKKYSKTEKPQNTRRIYLDFTIYTIVLDEKGSYQEIINHTSDDNIDEEKVKIIANRIIKNHPYNFYVGNLYTTKYAYTYTNNNNLIIMDNTNISRNLISRLLTNCVIFLICEGIIFVITNFLTKWMIVPVKKTFEKQKTFIADASHELKTPLSVMIASCDAYFNDKDDKWVHNMKSESERMIKLVTELLDIAKTEKEQEIFLENNNLSELIESSILTYESLCFENHISLDYSITKDIHLMCNEYLIEELMSILMDNAIQYSNKNGKVKVSLKKKNKQIILKVKNTGKPIKKEDEEKIFERFYKVDSSRNRNSNNYGLGLAIAKNIVKQHKGEISAYSSNGYTTFEVVWKQ